MRLGGVVVLLLVATMQLFALTHKITAVTANNASIAIEMLGKPAFKTDSFSRGGESYYILSFSNSILLGSPRLLHVLPEESATVIAAQFTVHPDVVHIVVRDHRKANYHVYTQHQKGDRYLIGLDFRERPRLKVFLDVGHGGYDPGGTGPEGLPESFVNLSVAKKLASILRSEGVGVELDRTGDTFVSLARRVALANESKANLFLGLYCNASKDHAIHGTTTYYYHPNAYAFARYLEKHVSQNLGLKNDGVEHDNLYVIRHTTTRIPDVLIEYAYISNPHEEQLLASPAFRDRIAAAIANAITGYFVPKPKQKLHPHAVWVTSVKASRGSVRIHSLGKPALGSFTLRKNGKNYYVVTLKDTILAGRTRSFKVGPPFSGKVTVAQYSVKPDVVRLAVKEKHHTTYQTSTREADASHFVTTISPHSG